MCVSRPSSITYDRIIESNGRYWLPESELNQCSEVVECEGEFWDVIGYSKSRRSYLICPIHVDGSADKAEEEWETTITPEGQLSSEK